MTMPKITLLFALLHVLLMIVLLARVARCRRDLKGGLGGGVLLIARVLHSISLFGSRENSLGRLGGTLLTWVVLAAMALIGIRLSLSTF